jgi:xanthine dehydrogenase YagR molybdenum-binding subunit
VKRVDVSKAAALPGVLGVLTADNAPKLPWYAGKSFLFDPHVRLVGDEVAAVAAINERVAEDALSLIDVEYEILPHVVDQMEAMKPGAPQLHDEEKNIKGGAPAEYARGDVEKGLAAADVVIEGTFTVPGQNHSCQERHGSTVEYGGSHVTVWDGTQGTFRVRNELAVHLGLPANRVRVIMQHMGGGFGQKNFCDKYTVIGALLSKMTGRPVQISLDRQQCYQLAAIRPGAIQQIKLGAKRDGTLTAIDYTSYANLGSQVGKTGLVGADMATWAQSKNAMEHYKCENVKTTVYGIYTNTPTNTPYRAPGPPEASWCVEQAMDMLAEKVGMCPVELRMKNYSAMDQVGGVGYTEKALDICYKRGVEESGWTRRKPANSDPGPKKRGMGMGSVIWFCFQGPPAVGIVKLNADGSANIVAGTQDTGVGDSTVMSQIVAEELGMSFDQVSMVNGDTSACPYANNNWGSIMVGSMGPALRLAANDAKNQLLEKYAAELLEVSADQLDMKDGKIFVKTDPSKSIAIADACGKMGDNMIVGRGSRGPNPPKASGTIFGAQFAEVEVDVETGVVDVIKLVAAHDLGRVVNPATCGNQIIGGAIQGLGYGLMEEPVIDAATGVMLNTNMHEYMLPTVQSCPDVVPIMVEDKPDPINFNGTKGIGEPPIVAINAALANAVYNACGARVMTSPLTPNRILAAL